MIIYEFSTWCTNGKMFSVKEIEVEEKPKTYIGKGIRINKYDIDKLQSGYGNKMYRLEKDSKPYIEAMIKQKKRHIDIATDRLKQANTDFNKWYNLKETAGAGND